MWKRKGYLNETQPVSVRPSGLRIKRAEARKALHPGKPLRRQKGKPESPAVTGKAGKPRVAEPDLVSEEAAGQNNSNLTS